MISGLPLSQAFSNLPGREDKKRKGAFEQRILSVSQDALSELKNLTYTQFVARTGNITVDEHEFSQLKELVEERLTLVEQKRYYKALQHLPQEEVFTLHIPSVQELKKSLFGFKVKLYGETLFFIDYESGRVRLRPLQDNEELIERMGEAIPKHLKKRLEHDSLFFFDVMPAGKNATQAAFIRIELLRADESALKIAIHIKGVGEESEHSLKGRIETGEDPFYDLFSMQTLIDDVETLFPEALEKAARFSAQLELQDLSFIDADTLRLYLLEQREVHSLRWTLSAEGVFIRPGGEKKTKDAPLTRHSLLEGLLQKSGHLKHYEIKEELDEEKNRGNTIQIALVFFSPTFIKLHYKHPGSDNITEKTFKDVETCLQFLDEGLIRRTQESRGFGHQKLLFSQNRFDLKKLYVKKRPDATFFQGHPYPFFVLDKTPGQIFYHLSIEGEVVETMVTNDTLNEYLAARYREFYGKKAQRPLLSPEDVLWKSPHFMGNFVALDVVDGENEVKKQFCIKVLIYTGIKGEAQSIETTCSILNFDEVSSFLKQLRPMTTSELAACFPYLPETIVKRDKSARNVVSLFFDEYDTPFLINRAGKKEQLSETVDIDRFLLETLKVECKDDRFVFDMDGKLIYLKLGEYMFTMPFKPVKKENKFYFRFRNPHELGGEDVSFDCQGKLEDVLECLNETFLTTASRVITQHLFQPLIPLGVRIITLDVWQQGRPPAGYYLKVICDKVALHQVTESGNQLISNEKLEKMHLHAQLILKELYGIEERDFPLPPPDQIGTRLFQEQKAYIERLHREIHEQYGAWATLVLEDLAKKYPTIKVNLQEHTLSIPFLGKERVLFFEITAKSLKINYLSDQEDKAIQIDRTSLKEAAALLENRLRSFLIENFHDQNECRLYESTQDALGRSSFPATSLALICTDLQTIQLIKQKRGQDGVIQSFSAAQTKEELFLRFLAEAIQDMKTTDQDRDVQDIALKSERPGEDPLLEKKTLFVLTWLRRYYPEFYRARTQQFSAGDPRFSLTIPLPENKYIHIFVDHAKNLQGFVGTIGTQPSKKSFASFRNFTIQLEIVFAKREKDVMFFTDKKDIPQKQAERLRLKLLAIAMRYDTSREIIILEGGSSDFLTNSDLYGLIKWEIPQNRVLALEIDRLRKALLHAETFYVTSKTLSSVSHVVTYPEEQDPEVDYTVLKDVVKAVQINQRNLLEFFRLIEQGSRVEKIGFPSNSAREPFNQKLRALVSHIASHIIKASLEDETTAEKDLLVIGGFHVDRKKLATYKQTLREILSEVSVCGPGVHEYLKQTYLIMTDQSQSNIDGLDLNAFVAHFKEQALFDMKALREGTQNIHFESLSRYLLSNERQLFENLEDASVPFEILNQKIEFTLGYDDDMYRANGYQGIYKTKENIVEVFFQMISPIRLADFLVKEIERKQNLKSDFLLGLRNMMKEMLKDDERLKKLEQSREKLGDQMYQGRVDELLDEELIRRGFAWENEELTTTEPTVDLIPALYLLHANGYLALKEGSGSAR